MPVAILWLVRFDRRLWSRYLVAVVGFLLFSSPWWIYDFTHNHAAMGVFLGGSKPVITGLPPALLARLQLLLFLGIPALVGLRFPWAADYVMVYLAPLVLAFYLAAAVGLWRRWPSKSHLRKSGAWILILFGAGIILLLIGTQFGLDVTGRFLVPLYAPLCIAVGGWWSGLRYRSRAWCSVGLALLLAFNVTGVILGAGGPAGLTTLYIPAQQIGNSHDAELIRFLQDNQMPYGYSHHWVSFKIAFLSREQVILAPLLPYQDVLDHDPDLADRYPPYTDLVETAASPVYVTSNQPWMDEKLRDRLRERGDPFVETTIGPYRVFHHLTGPASPTDLGLFSTVQD
jgi:hypothetical protein